MITDRVYLGRRDEAGRLMAPLSSYQLHYHDGAAWEAVQGSRQRGLTLRSRAPERLLNDLLALVAIDGFGMEPENPEMTQGFYVLTEDDEVEAERLASFALAQEGYYLGFCWAERQSAFKLKEIELMAARGRTSLLVWKRDAWSFDGPPSMELPPEAEGAGE